MFKDLKSNVRKVSELMGQCRDYYHNYRWKINDGSYVFCGVVGPVLDTIVLELTKRPGEYMRFYTGKNDVKIKYNRNYNEFKKEIKTLDDMYRAFDWKEENVKQFIKHLELYVIEHI